MPSSRAWELIRSIQVGTSLGTVMWQEPISLPVGYIEYFWSEIGGFPRNHLSDSLWDGSFTVYFGMTWAFIFRGKLRASQHFLPWVHIRVDILTAIDMVFWCGPYLHYFKHASKQFVPFLQWALSLSACPFLVLTQSTFSFQCNKR